MFRIFNVCLNDSHDVYTTIWKTNEQTRQRRTSKFLMYVYISIKDFIKLSILKEKWRFLFPSNLIEMRNTFVELLKAKKKNRRSTFKDDLIRFLIFHFFFFSFCLFFSFRFPFFFKIIIRISIHIKSILISMFILI